MENKVIKNSSYCDKMEANDAQLLREFNDQVHWFSSLTPNEQYAEIDFVGYDSKSGRTSHIELKRRSGTIKQYIHWGDVIIEPSKISRTTKIMESGHSLNEQRLFINFVDDGVIIYNLNRVSRMNFYPNHKHFNPVKGLEHEDRFGLPIEQAIIYQRDREGKYNRVFVKTS